MSAMIADTKAALPLTPFMALAAVYTLRDLAAAHLVVRDHERTLTAADANRLRDRVYAALHEGTAHEWAAG